MQAQTDYKVINMDQWMGFLRFCNEVLLFFPHMVLFHTCFPVWMSCRLADS